LQAQQLSSAATPQKTLACKIYAAMMNSGVTLKYMEV
jgi:hypothetical protein